MWWYRKYDGWFLLLNFFSARFHLQFFHRPTNIFSVYTRRYWYAYNKKRLYAFILVFMILYRCTCTHIIDNTTVLRAHKKSFPNLFEEIQFIAAWLENISKYFSGSLETTIIIALRLNAKMKKIIFYVINVKKFFFSAITMENFG